jgi:hypothetical protein
MGGEYLTELNSPEYSPNDSPNDSALHSPRNPGAAGLTGRFIHLNIHLNYSTKNSPSYSLIHLSINKHWNAFYRG